jgi:hypothetical protein
MTIQANMRSKKRKKTWRKQWRRNKKNPEIICDLQKKAKKTKKTTNQQRKKIENINDCEMRGESLWAFLFITK